MREVHTSGIICINDNYGFTYQTCKIEYILFEDETFKYIFTPFYNIIEFIPSKIFQGIPGLDLELKKVEYVRENKIPVFISERTPSTNREDFWQLLDNAGMEYLNPLEWLIRTSLQYSGDDLYVVRSPQDTTKKIVYFDSLNELGDRNQTIMRKLLEFICTNTDFISQELTIDDRNRKYLYEVLMPLYVKSVKYQLNRQKLGIEHSREKFRGRKKIPIDAPKLTETMTAYLNGKVSIQQACQTLHVSEATFFRRLREYKQHLVS
ncbi:MAG: hypothetical protein SPD11_09065 [Sphaerochaetaceae bacterium]|nr:hypothetical protein [Sphaerochaetaceae bacterium]